MTIPKFRSSEDPIADIGTLGEFWRWAMSDMLGNRNRGIFAEYLVGKALGDETLTSPRMEWDCYDLEYRSCRIEVKSSAFVQTWHQDIAQRSKLVFGIGPHGCWDARTNTTLIEKKRHADLYVFCIFPAERDSTSRDVLDLSQWRFYVTTTTQLETCLPSGSRTIGLTKVREICGQPVAFPELKSSIDGLVETIRRG